MESPRRVLTRRGLSIWRQRQGKHVRRAEDAKNCRPSGRQFENIERKSALAELGSPTGGFEAVLLALLHTGIAGEETSSLQGSAELRVHLQQLSLIHI